MLHLNKYVSFSYKTPINYGRRLQYVPNFTVQFYRNFLFGSTIFIFIVCFLREKSIKTFKEIGTQCFFSNIFFTWAGCISVLYFWFLFLLILKLFYLSINFIGVFGWCAGLLWGASNMFFTSAVQSTAVANVLVIVASNTVFSSIFSYFLLGELIPLRMWITSAICFGAIALIFSGKSTADNSLK